MLDWETERLVSREKYNALQKDRERRHREAEAYNSGHASHRQSSRYYQQQHEPSQPRLKRRRRFERHDIWTCGRRLRSWGL